MIRKQTFPESKIMHDDYIAQPVTIRGEVIQPPAPRPLGRVGKFLGRIGLAVAGDTPREQRGRFLRDVINKIPQGPIYQNELDAMTGVELTSDDFEAFGFVQEEYEDSPKHADFHKENDVTLDTLKNRSGHDWYRVVNDKVGSSWLLKSLNRRKDAGNDRIDALSRSIMHGVGEVTAFRLGNKIGYPVPETKLSFFDGKPWLAYRYIDNHKYHFMDDDPGELANPEAVKTRFLYNALIGSGGDNTGQGIIDPQTRKYYAQDINAYIPLSIRDRSKAELRDVFEQDFGLKPRDETRKDSTGGYGVVRRDLTAPERDYAKQFLRRAQHINPGEASYFFPTASPDNQDPVAVLKNVKLRAAVLLEMLDQGVFSPDRGIITEVPGISRPEALTR